MTLDLHYEQLGVTRREYAVQPTGEDTLPPVTLIIQEFLGPFRFQEYFSADDARRLAWALIDQANRADVRSGKAGADPNLVARAEAA